MYFFKISSVFFGLREIENGSYIIKFIAIRKCRALLEKIESEKIE